MKKINMKCILKKRERERALRVLEIQLGCPLRLCTPMEQCLALAGQAGLLPVLFGSTIPETRS
jgi:hypothetical protein